VTLAYFAAAWFAGTVAAALGWDERPIIVAGVVLLAALAAFVLVRRRPSTALLGFICAALFAGAFLRFDPDNASEAPSGIAALNDGASITFRALVIDEPDESGRYVSTRVDVKSVRQDDGSLQASSGGVLLQEPAPASHSYGDLLEITAKLETPPELPNFDYRQYLARQGIDSIAYYPEVTVEAAKQGNAAWFAIHRLRRDLSSSLAGALPEPQASLAQGILLGERSTLSQDLKDDLNATSTSHIIALSGYNVTLLAGLIIGAFAWLIGRRRAAFLALAAIAGYTLFTGASPSLVRAAIMGALYLTATLLGRPNSGLVSLLVAAAVMAGLQPDVVRDISFQLSFAATAGLIVLVPLLRDRIDEASERLGWMPAPPGRGIANALFEIAIVTIAASLATLPLIALHFQRISLIALPANLLVLPAFPFILFSSTVVAVVGLASEPAAHVTGWFAWLGLSYMVAMVRFLAAVPFASLEVRRFNIEMCAVSYGLLAGMCWLLSCRRPGEETLRRLWRPVGRALAVPARPLLAVPAGWLAIGLALSALLTWMGVLSSPNSSLAGIFAAPDGRLTVEVFDVGQGDSILIRTPGGHKLLVDGGPDGEVVEQELGEALPFWDKKLDMVLLTHPDSDHLTGLLSVVDRCDVGQVVKSPFDSETNLAKTWEGLIGEEDIRLSEVEAGGWVDLGRGAQLEILGPPKDPLTGTSADSNNNSLVLKLTWGSVSFLLTGDLEAAGEEDLLEGRADLRATVLKVAHHGSAYATTQEFLDAVDPDLSVISVGAGNDFGHPAPSTLERLDDTILYRTDEQGDVTFSTDGERLWVSVERDQPPLPDRLLPSP
jgi:competence protein ComEC